MPPAKRKGRGAGGSRSRRRRAPGISFSPGVRTRSSAEQAEPSPSPQLGKRTRTVVEKSNSSKKANARNGDEENRAAVSASAQVVSDRTIQEEAEAASPGAAASDSDQVSSPLRCPYIPDIVKFQDSKRVVYEPVDSVTLDAYYDEDEKYQAKLNRCKKLVTLDTSGPTTCLDHSSLLPDRESVTQIVFQTAKAVLGLSSYIDGKLLARCSGFLIDWDRDTRCGTVLTSAKLLCTKSPKVDLWSCPREYAPEAEVLIHLLDNTIVKGKLIHYHKHYNIALFEVIVNMPMELPVSSEQIDYGQEVFIVGRDENLNLNASYGRVDYIDPGLFDHYHSMYVDCGVSKFGAGGPVIDTKGRVVGMADPTPRAAFIPTSFILRCLRMWKNFKCVPRLHLGLKFSSIKFLRGFHREKISRMFNIDAGLIIREVSEGSIAEKIGIRTGDVIESLNGECFPTVAELEIMLLRTCENCLDKGSGLGSNVDLTIGLFQIRKVKHCTKMLKLNISDDVEVIAECTYPVSAT